MCHKKYAKDIDRAVFPGLQGGPHDHITAAKALTFKEAMQAGVQGLRPPDRGQCEGPGRGRCSGTDSISFPAGTDNHLVLVDLTNKGIIGKDAETALDKAGLTVNKNTVPFDTRSPLQPQRDPHRHAGGHDARNERTRDEKDRRLDRHGDRKPPGNDEKLASIHDEVRELCAGFPVPGISTAGAALIQETGAG